MREDRRRIFAFWRVVKQKSVAQNNFPMKHGEKPIIFFLGVRKKYRIGLVQALPSPASYAHPGILLPDRYQDREFHRSRDHVTVEIIT